MNWAPTPKLRWNLAEATCSLLCLPFQIGDWKWFHSPSIHCLFSMFVECCTYLGKYPIPMCEVIRRLLMLFSKIKFVLLMEMVRVFAKEELFCFYFQRKWIPTHMLLILLIFIHTWIVIVWKFKKKFKFNNWIGAIP